MNLEKTAVSEIGLDNDVYMSMAIFGRRYTVYSRHNEPDLSGVCSAGEMCIYLELAGSSLLEYLFDLGLIKGYKSIENIITRSIVIITTCDQRRYMTAIPS